MRTVAPSTELRLPARYYALLLDLLRASGVRVDPILRRAGLSRPALELPDASIGVAQVDVLIESVIRAAGRSDLGFHLGRSIKPSSHEVLGHALMSCATLDEALRLAARYWALITPAFAMRHRHDATGVHIEFDPVTPFRPNTLRFHLEAIATAFHAEIGFLLSGRTPVYDLYLPDDLSDAKARYRQLAPARVHFVALPFPALRIVLSAPLASRTLELADRHALAQARRLCEEALSRMTHAGSLSGWVTRLHSDARDRQPRQADIAKLLYISTRTMNRRLAAEGAGYRELGKQHRHARARHMLDDGSASITEIALLLGYRDVANFSRAFRRDAGMSPSEYRRRPLL
ncbi:MAG: AraC family transcriptional regulator ligand-binding domain-containing protein [Tahibacter sp.]